jgi:hypothetical protein
VSVDDDGLDADSLDELWDGVWADVEEPELVSCCELPPPAPTASKPAAATPIMAFMTVSPLGSSAKGNDRQRRREVRTRRRHHPTERGPARLRRRPADCDIRVLVSSRRQV